MRSFQAYIPDNLPPFPETSDEKPLDIEIGCGVGLHPILYCQENPNRQLVAIEHTAEKFEKFLRRAKNHDLNNLFPLHGNGISLTAKYLKPNSVDRFLFMYPNPNPKPGDTNKRWHAMPFMGRVWHCLKDGGEVVIVTNEKWYHEEAIKYFETEWKYPVSKKLAFNLNSHPEKKPRTHFEKKYLERGETCYELWLQKSDLRQ